MDNNIIDEYKFFAEAMQLIINNYHFEIMICLQMSILNDDDVKRYVAAAALSAIPAVPLNVLADGRAALLQLLAPAGLTTQTIPLHLDTLGKTMKLINDYIDREYDTFNSAYNSEMDESNIVDPSTFDEQIEALLFEGTKESLVGGNSADKLEGGARSDSDSDDEDGDRGYSSDDDKPPARRREKPSRGRPPLPPRPHRVMPRNHIINTALTALVTELNDRKMEANILRNYSLSETSIDITKSLVNIWYNVTMNDTLSQLLIDAYGIGSLSLPLGPSGSKMNYYEILDYVFNSVEVVNDHVINTMNLLHGIYNTMIFWKFGKLEGSNIVSTTTEYEQNRNAHEVQLSAASYILQDTLYEINKLKTPRGVESTGASSAGFGGTTKKKKNLKKKKSTKAKKKRKNNKKSKRKLKLMKKTIKVNNIKYK